VTRAHVPGTGSRAFWSLVAVPVLASAVIGTRAAAWPGERGRRAASPRSWPPHSPVPAVIVRAFHADVRAAAAPGTAGTYDS
jgi:hypothetical protein